MPTKVDQYLLEGTKIDFDLVRKKSVKRNILVRFEENGRMKVSAPIRASRKNVHLVLSGMHDQIAELRRQVTRKNRDVPVIRYRQGSRHSFLGESYFLTVERNSSRRRQVKRHTDHIAIHVQTPGEEVVRDTLWQWYRAQAMEYFSGVLLAQSKQVSWLHGLPYDLRLRRMKRSWGTCSASGMITLNPLLMKASPRHIDYVIAHEQCHLREMNHSAAFYRLLAELKPDWQTLRAELNEKSHVYLRW